MAKSKKDMLKSTLRGGIKKQLPDTNKIEEITKKVYGKKTPAPSVVTPKTTPKPPTKPKSTPAPKAKAEPTHRTTIDMPKSLHILVKVEAMKDGVSLKKFILHLVEKELKKRGSL